jgi:hypothetical protein
MIVTSPFLVQITSMRVEILGTGFTAQHSDARVLDQLVYKWHHSRQVGVPLKKSIMLREKSTFHRTSAGRL